MRGKSRCGGFTLIELLVVIGILGVLAAMILPSFSHATFQAKNTRCKNNLRQIGIGVQLYVTTYEGYPPYFKHTSGAGHQSMALMWDQFLEPFLFPRREVVPFLYASGMGPPGGRRVERFFICPFLGPRLPHMPFGWSWLMAPIYGYNAFGVGDSQDALGLGDTVSFHPAAPSRYTRESAVTAPSEMIAVGDHFARSEVPDQDGLFKYGLRWQPAKERFSVGWPSMIQSSAAMGKTHRSKFNKVFCDGHVVMENFKKPFMASDEYLRRWNVDHEPHRELWK